MSRPLRICLDARIWPGLWGGVEPYIMQVGRALLALSDGDERYSFLVHEPSVQWVRDRISPDATVIMDKTPESSSSDGGLAMSSMRRFIRSPRRFVSTRWRAWQAERLMSVPLGEVPAGVPSSTGAVERAGIDLIHFMHQAGFATRVRSIYQPHDFQHMHLPDLFTAQEREWRGVLYPCLCRRASAIVAVSTWTKDDIVRWTSVDPGKVRVMPYPPPLGGYGQPTPADLAAAREKFDLPESYLLYAAQTWAHKNHVGLLRALAVLRDRGVVVNVVCSGHKNEYFPVIQGEIDRLNLAAQVRFVGFVTPLEIKCLYDQARGVVIPTRFEAASYPMWEAFREGRAVACSNVTALPKQAGDSALLFDPEDPASIAGAMERLWTDGELRATLAQRGKANLSRFTPERSARAFRALYRELCGRSLTLEDRALLAAPPML